MWILIGAFIGIVVVLGSVMVQKKHIEQAQQQEDSLMREAEQESQDIIQDAKKRSDESKQASVHEIELRKEHVDKLQQKMENKENMLNARIKKIEEAKSKLLEKQRRIDEVNEKLNELTTKQIEALAKKINVLPEKIKDSLIAEYTHQFEEENKELLSKYGEAEADEYEKRSFDLLKLAIQRYSAETSREQVATTVNFKNKRNRKRVLGTDEEKYLDGINKKLNTELVYEWGGNTLEIYGHDLFKRNIIKLMLTNLLKNPKLDQDAALQLAKKTISVNLVKFGNKAITQLGLKNLPEQLVKLIGRLYYRTSFGQNILKHSVEVGYIAEMLAAEIGADTEIAKLGGLLHDIGKAVDTEVSGAHDAIGRDIAIKFNLPEPIINAIYAHHEAEPFKYVESRIVQVADAISASRPGARHQESLEEYLERIEKLESITAEYEGIEKSYAISAGRELRVLVNPDELSDKEAAELTENIAKKIEDELTYPGEIKINLIREKKVIDFAN